MKSLDDARRLDAADPLRRFAADFALPEGVIYLDGNSLGAPPRRALDRLAQTANEEWRNGLIRSWNAAGWIDLPKRAGAKIARLIGADEDSVVVCDSVSVNLFKLAAALIARNPGAALCVDAAEFPTDQHVLEGVARMTGAPLLRLDDDDIPDHAVLVRSLAHYKSAEILDMAAMESVARKKRCDIIWDLSHAAGLVAVDMKEAGARFAVGCGYKFLNGGPGAPAFISVAREEAEQIIQPISGWMGHAAPFDFSSDYAPADGVQRFNAGTPPILSLSALDAALDVFDGLDLNLLETKARALGEFFLDCVDDLPLTPLPTPARRGGHVCLRSDDGYAIMQALIARGVIGDFRAPDLMRFGFAPLYISFENVRRAAETLREVLSTQEWRRAEFGKRGKVT
ncbi:MAG: kynureninase [Parvularculaceae bacterium]